ncbi:MAG: glycosyltransferase [Phototrophicaceae bacterium]
MKITLITVGSRGDIQPYVPLAMGFRDAGYDMTIATHEPYREFVESHGIKFLPVAGDPQAMLAGESGIEWVETQSNPLAALSKMRDLVTPLVMEMAQSIITAAEGADAILYSTLGFLAAPSLIEKNKIPGMGVYLQPVNPTRDYPFFMLPRLPFDNSTINQASYTAINMLTGALFRSMVNRVRTELMDLAPYQENFNQFIQRPYPIAYGYSPSVQAQPADWGKHLKVTGYWFLDEPYTPSPEFAAWLANGDKPIYVGFGSMTNRNPAEMTEIVLASVEQAGVRCVLLSGWAGIGNDSTSEDVFVVDAIPHHWLFPQMQAVVHHGGAGTTAAGLRSGVPSILIPHFVDQPYWAKRVETLGVGPAAIPRNHLSVDALTRAIRLAIYDRPMQGRAAEVGERIRAQDGIQQAIDFFENYVLKQDISTGVYH